MISLGVALDLSTISHVIKMQRWYTFQNGLNNQFSNQRNSQRSIIEKARKARLEKLDKAK
ncbi:MAG TPA: hypothetical protein DCE28_11120 [Halomonas sp.]|nr:hypothetical protein [Halomonas sp.]